MAAAWDATTLEERQKLVAYAFDEIVVADVGYRVSARKGRLHRSLPPELRRRCDAAVPTGVQTGAVNSRECVSTVSKTDLKSPPA